MKINYWFLLVTITLTCCTQNTIGSTEETKNYSTHSNVLSTSIQPYEITALENFMQEELCGGFYNTKTKQCDNKAVSNITNTTKLNSKFDLTKRPIENNGLGITSIELQQIHYATSRGYYDGIIMLPKGIKKDKIKGVILYFHPTIFDKSSVPSLKTVGEADKYYAAIYASQGYIVVAPDYIGMGNDYKNVHPYIIQPMVNVLNANVFLHYANSIIDNTYGNKTYNLYTVGYSEGAAYSVWFNKYFYMEGHITNPGYKLIASVGIDGAYNLSNTALNFLTSNANIANFKGQYQYITNLVKPALITLALATYNRYILNQPISYGFNLNFFNMSQCYPTGFACKFTDINGTKLNNMNLEAAIYQPSINNINFPQTIFTDAINQTGSYNGVTYKYEQSTNVISDKNSGYSLYDGRILNSNEFKQVLEDADIYKYEAQIPVHLISLELDSVVSPINTDTFINSNKLTKRYIKNSDFYVKNPFYNTIGEKYIFGEEANNLDHIKAEPFLNIAALDYIEKINANLNK